MTAGGHKKFLFDTDFAPDAEAKVQHDAARQAELEAELAEAAAQDAEEIEEYIPPTFSEEDLERARKEGFQEGHTEATRDLTSALEQRLSNTMDTINTQVANLFDAYAIDKEEHSRDAVAVATVIVRKLFPALNLDKDMAEIEHMIVEAMKRTSGAPSLVVRVPSEVRDTVNAKAQELAALRGREGTINVMADTTMSEGDAAVEWDGGGMTRDSKLMWQEIDEIIERNLGTERANGHAESAILDDADAPQEAELEGTPEILPEMAEEEAIQEVVNDAPVEDNTQSALESAPAAPELEIEPETEPEAPLDVQQTEQQAGDAADDAMDAAPEVEPSEDETLGEETPETPETEG